MTGQDGSYLSEFLIAKGYKVFGLARYKSTSEYPNLSNLIGNGQFTLVFGDMTDGFRLKDLMAVIQPDEIYNLAAQSHVGESFRQPLYTSDVNAMGVARLLVAMEEYAPDAKFYQASTSELFGKTEDFAQDESTPMSPRSPYAVSKLYAHYLVKNYRERGFFCCSGILFNHESPRRGENFVTRKITKGVARIAYELNSQPLELGNLNSSRDWGFAGDYVKAMWLMLQRNNPSDYVISTGKTTTVRDFVSYSFACAGIQITWMGHGLDEVGVNSETGEILVRINPKFYRPTEVDFLRGNSEKAL